MFAGEVALMQIKINGVAPSYPSLLAAVRTKRRLGNRKTRVELLVLGVDGKVGLAVFTGIRHIN